MKKITLFIVLLLSGITTAYSQAVEAYTRTTLTGQTYTPISGGTLINSNSAFLPDVYAGNQDDGAVLVTLPFTFTYGGNTFTQATFCTNGWVGMGDLTGITTAQSYASANLFTATVPNNIIGAWFGDILANIPAGGGSMVHGAVGTGAYAFEWRNVSGINTYQSAASTINFMIVLHGPASATPGRIEMLYGTQTGTLAGNKSIGIEGATGGAGNFINALNGSNTLTTLATVWPGNGNGYRFDPNTAACSTLTGGTIVGGNNIYACTGAAPAPIHVSGATPALTGVIYEWQQSYDNGTTWLPVSGGSGAATLSYTPPVFNGTSVQYRLKVACSSAEAFSQVATLTGPGAPGIQASGINVSFNSTNIVVNYAIGNGSRRVVIMSDAPITDPTSSEAPSPAASTTYQGGQQVMYNGTANTTTLTGVPCTGGTFYFKVYEVLLCGTTYYYNTTTVTNTATIVVPPLPTPAVQATNLTVSSVPGQLTTSWANGSGSGRMVIISDTPIVDPVDEVGIAAYTTSTNYLGGQQIVYAGVAASITINGIPCGGGGPYYIKVFEYERCGTTGNYSYKFNITSGTNSATITPAGVTAPTNQATNLVVTPGEDSFNVAWDNGNGNYRMVLVDNSPIADMLDTSGPTTTGDASWNDAGLQVVYNGTGSSVNVTAASCATGDVYYVKVIEYNRCGSSSPYDFFFNNTTGTNAATYTIAGPPQASAIAVTSSTPNSVALSWTEGTDTGSLVVISDSPVITDPVDQSGIAAITASTTYAGGQQVIYASTATSVTVNSLVCGTTYYVKVFSYYRCGTTGNYNYRFNVTPGTNTLTVTPQLDTFPLPQATDFEGFTGANLATTSENWYESRIATTAGQVPGTSNPVGITSNWLSSTGFGTTTARVNLVSAIKNEWLISPKTAITGPSRVRFKAAITANGTVLQPALGMADTDDQVRVLISTDGCGINWTELYVFNANSVGNLSNQLVDFSLPIDGTYIGQNIQIAFHAFDGTTDDPSNYDFHIGNVAIELVPACDRPSVISNPVSAVTETGATVSWGVPGAGTPGGYQYVFSTSDTAPAVPGTGVTTPVASATTTLSPSTNYYTWVRTSCSPGFSEWIMVGAFRTRCDAAEVLTPTGASRCGAGSVNLTASTTPGATLSWYADATGGTPLATGTTYSPTVAATTTYYVGTSNSAGTIATSGNPAPTPTSTGLNGTNYGVIFNVTEDLLINTVDVYSVNDGTINVAIVTAAGVQLFETGQIQITGAGTAAPNVIPINYNIAPGEGYKMVIKSFDGVSLIRLSSGATFPYNGSDGKLNVMSSWTTSAGTTTYYYFYNFNYTPGCFSARTPVVATVHNNPNTPTGAATQTISANTAEEATIEDIVITETGVLWYASEADAIAGVSPLAAGTQVFAGTTYYATLPAGSCVPLAVTITQVLGSKGFDRSQFTYYPNPVKDVLNLKYASEISGVEVYNLLGQKIVQKAFNAASIAVDLSAIADGNYIVKVASADGVETIKIVKKN
ncbi:MAG: T9SS type A sorting domain-containing protein [Flavobacterium sp.]